MKVIKRFADWVDSKGEGAGDHMVAGAFFGAMVAGALTLCAGFILGPSSPVAAVGVSVVLLHILVLLAVA